MGNLDSFLFPSSYPENGKNMHAAESVGKLWEKHLTL